MVTRGQAYTLEGVLAAILVVTATVYGLQAIDTRAWEDETRSETRQLQYRASDVLTVATESGAMREAVLCYRPGRPLDGGRNRALAPFEQILNTTFDQQANQYDLYFSYWNRSGARQTTLVSEQDSGTDKQPPTSAAVASTTVTLTDNMDRRRGNRCNPIPLSIQNDTGYYIREDIDEGSPLYNIVEVRLVVW